MTAVTRHKYTGNYNNLLKSITSFFSLNITNKAAEEKNMFMPLNVALISVCIPLWVPLIVPAKALNQFGELTSGRDEGTGITSNLPLHSRKTISALPKGTRVTNHLHPF